MLSRVALIVAAVLSMASLASALQQVEFKHEFGMEGSGPGQISRPSHLAIDSDGKIYLADRGNRRIQVMTKDGKTITTWSGQRGDSWYLEEPSGIDVCGDKVFVTDAALHRVLVFSKDGKFVDQFGSRGDDPKQFDNPGGICVHQGIIYVADTGNHRVQSFSIDGIYLGSIGEKGKEAGEMREPTDVAVDPSGLIYVADSGNNRVQAFFPTGKHHRSYYEMEEPSAIATDNSGFYVADAGNYRVRKYAFNGNILASFGMEGENSTQFRTISGISLDRNNGIYVADSSKNTIQVFSPDKTPERAVEPAPPINSVKWLTASTAAADDVAWDGDLLYAPSADEHAVLVIQNGSVRRIIKGQGKDNFREPRSIAIDPDGFILVLDSGDERIIKLNRDGAIVSAFGGSGGKDGLLSSPQGITVSSKGIVYVADTGNERVQLFNTNGIYMGKIEKFGAVDQYEFDRPVDVGLDPSGNIYVVDEGRNLVLKFNSQKRFVATIGREGEGEGELSKPRGVLVTREEIFVLDAGNRRIQIFDHNGKFLRMFGAPGSGTGDFIEPTGFSLKDGTTLFVSDRGAKRIQAFGLLYTPQTPAQLKAEPERGGVNLSWAKNFESYFGTFRVYRSDNGGNYALIASSQIPAYTDREVQPGITYYYRVTAVAREGNESAKSHPAGGKPQKLVTPPPTGLKASPGETDIALTWKPAEGSSSSAYFIVYREIDGVLKEIGRVRNPSFRDKGLKPKTEYRYQVSALSPDAEESSRVSLSATTILNRPVIEVTAVKIHDIFPRASKLYEKDGIGRLRITNTGEKPVEQVKISFITKDFMDNPTELLLRQIKPGEGIDVDVKPVSFNNKILSLKENTSVKADIAVTYSIENAAYSFTTAQNLMVILTGRSYSDAEIKRFTRAMRALDDKVSKAKADKEAAARIRNEFETQDAMVRDLRSKNLGYGEIVACLYLSNSTKKSPEDILTAKIGGQNWHDLMSIFDLNISDATNTLKEITDSIGVKAPPKPAERKREAEKYVK